MVKTLVLNHSAEVEEQVRFPFSPGYCHRLFLVLLKFPVTTVGGKIIRALEIIRVKKFIPNALINMKKVLSSHDLQAKVSTYYSWQQNYSSTCDNICDFPLV